VCTYVPAHITTHILTTTHRGGSLELATIIVCIVAYSLCLTSHTTSALLLTPVRSLLWFPPTSFPFPLHTHTPSQCVWVGSVHSCRASKTFTGSQFALCYFLPCQSFCSLNLRVFHAKHVDLQCLHLYKVIINYSLKSMAAF